MANVPYGMFIATADNFIQLFDYDGSNHVIYQGWAQPGTSTSADGWRIKQLNYTGDNIVSILWPSGSPAFSFVWSNRATYTYS